MTFTIGRASFAGSPYDLRHDGDRLSFAIDIDTESAASVAAAKVLRQQVLGLADNADEPVIPVTWSDDSDLDGFYRVGRVEVAPFPVFLANGFAPCRIDLERVGGGFAEPVHEVYAIAVDASSADLSISNEWGASGIANQGAVYLPSSFTVINDATLTTGRDVEDGTTIQEIINTVNDSGSWTVGVSHLADAADFYDAAAVIERQVSSTWYTVVGRQVPQDATLRLSNGIVRVSVASSGEITVSHWDGAAWVSKAYTITYNSGSGTISSFGSVRIYRNSPDTVAARFTGLTSGAEACHIDVLVQRGHNVAEFRVSTYSNQTWKVTRSSTEAATEIIDASSAVVAVRATSNDGNGDRFVLSGREVVTSDTNGGITFGATGDPDSAGSFPGLVGSMFGIGMEIDGSAATGDANTADALAARYQIAMFLTRSVVS